MPAPEPVVSELIELLSLERLEDNLFRGQSRDIGTKYVFGGQVLGQALSAAQATVDGSNGERRAHSLHAYFLRAGNIEAPIVYEVDRTRDGGSFSVRRVTAIQHGRVIFFCAASFQAEEGGAEHQLSMPEVPQPEDIAPAPAVSSHKVAVPSQRSSGERCRRRACSLSTSAKRHQRDHQPPRTATSRSSTAQAM